MTLPILPMLRDESTPAHPDHDPRHPLVVFGDHRFCAGEALDVQRMAGPHMHSQIELNFVLEGTMTYWFDGRELTVDAGRLCLFWGMVPHQVIDRADPTRFVCLYVPMSVFLGLATLSQFRDAVFRGAVIEALHLTDWDRAIFLRWREELLSGDVSLIEIIRNELTARVLRIERDGWRDLREQGSAIPSLAPHGAERIEHVERMLRFVAEHALEEISVDAVAASTGLHPNYAMSLFKRSVGQTITQAINRHRLDTAQSLLISTDRSITEVVYDSGFGSVSRFYEAFASRFGERPTQFRQRMRAKAALPT
ncbi:MAG: helix-turn-helix domain-containing protein [Cypionkella sp.]